MTRSPGSGKTIDRRARMHGVRRTQEERSSDMRGQLLDATLQALEAHGFAGASISEILAFAQVSRGALLHHYPSKDELIAAAVVHLFQQRMTRFQKRLASLPTGAGSIRERVRIVHAEFERWFPVTIEFMAALRTNQGLREAFDRRFAASLEQGRPDYASMFAEFADTPAGHWIPFVVACFVRGLCLETIVNDAAWVRGTFDQFVSLLECYARETARSARPAARARRRKSSRPPAAS